MPKTIVNKTLFSDVFTDEMLSFYTDDPVAFVEDIVFNVKAKSNGGPYELTKQQIQMLTAVAHNNKVSTRSGRGVGKTSTLAFLIIWFLCTRPNAKVVATAPTFKQLNGVLWPEVAKWIKNSLVKDLFTITSKRIYLNESPNSWFADAITAREPEDVQGYHGDHLMIVLDEASGIADEIYDTIQGSLTQHDNKIVLTGNPTRTSGFFYDSHNKFRASWRTFKFSCLDSPLPKEDMVNEYREKYGENHTLYKVHILGEFPSGSPESLIPLEHVLRATEREVRPEGDIQIGVDVAHFGDDLTCIAWRHGYKVYDLITKGETSIPEVTGMVLNLVKEIRKSTKSDSCIRVCVDATGVGAGVADELALDRENNLEVVPVNFGNTGDANHEYMASILWDGLRDKIDVIELPDDVDMVAQISNRRYKITPSGKLRIEPKSEYKKDFGGSPDKADAVVLCFAMNKNNQVVLKSFDHLDPDIVRPMPGYMQGGRPLCSVFYNKNRTYSILFSTWLGGKLYIKDEYNGDDIVSTIASNIRARMPFERITGNQRMFGEHGEDVASQFSRCQISIYENYRYDEMGALEALNILIKNKRLIIDKRCIKLIDAMRKWNFNGNRGNLEIDYSMCYSLLNLISELKDEIIQQVTVQMFEPYTGQREEAIKSVGTSLNKRRKNNWMRSL